MIKFIIVFISIFLYADVRVFGESAKLADNRVFVDDSFLIKDSMFVSAKEIIYDKNNFWKNYLERIKPIIKKEKVVYVERDREWNIAELI